MTTYTANVTVPQSIDDSFAFIADPTNLPYYFPRITAAKLVGPELVRTTAVVDEHGTDDDHGDPVTADAWFTSDTEAHRIAWGSPDNEDYRGSLAALERENETELQLTLTTSASYPGIQENLEEALRSIAAKLAAG